MGYATHKRMSYSLLGAGLPTMERIVLLDMALAVEEGSLIYAWGHERLAVALDKEPGTKAAKRALERVLSSLVDKGLIVRTSRAYRGHNAEYRLTVAEGNGPHSERGPVFTEAAENGPRFEAEWAPVSEGLGPTLGGAPLPTHYRSTDTGHNNALPRRSMTNPQRENVLDALLAVAGRCESIDVVRFRDTELAHLDGLSFADRDARIRVWVGLRSRALTDAGDDLIEDDRLHDLLSVHGYTWPTRTPGASDSWAADHPKEEVAR